jgi:nitrate reductase (NAD(P)H)
MFCNRALINVHCNREKQFYHPGKAVVTLLCGPLGLIENAAIPGLEKMGFKNGTDIFGY